MSMSEGSENCIVSLGTMTIPWGEIAVLVLPLFESCSS